LDFEHPFEFEPVTVYVFVVEGFAVTADPVLDDNVEDGAQL
jgi:hypothetical protein